MQYLKRLLVNLFLGANVVTILLLWMCCACTWISPSVAPKLSVVTLAFPVFLLANLAFLFFWILFKIRYVWLPIVGFLCASGYIADYSPIRIQEDAPTDDVLSVISYNVGKVVGEELHLSFLEYMKRTDADIYCLQEVDPSLLSRSAFKKTLDSLGCKMLQDGNRCVISRLRFVSDTLPLNYASKIGNGSMACLLMYGTDTLLVVNNHLESYGLTDEERGEYKNAIKGKKPSETPKTGLMLARRLSETTHTRGVQVDSLCHFIDNHSHMSMIVCGDFNDTPISYAYQQVSDRLVCAWHESGSGVGLSYNQFGFFVRIDHLFHTPDWVAYGTRMDEENTLSDHYPLLTFLHKTSK